MRNLIQSPTRVSFQLIVGIGFLLSGLAAVAALGPAGLIASLMFLPLFLGVIASTRRDQKDPQICARTYLTGCLSRFLGQIEHPTVAVAVELDGLKKLEEVYGPDAVARAVTFANSVIEESLTEQDIVVHLEGGRFIAALAPQAPFESDAMLNTCTRIQHGLRSATHTTDLMVPLTACIGFAASNTLRRPTAETLYQAAFDALSDAKGHGSGAMRAYSPEISLRQSHEKRIAREAASALEQGELVAYFQPQLDVGRNTLVGFEALARWHHPERGLILPSEFLHGLEKAGQMPRLGETMMKHALMALNDWDKAGLHVPSVGVNFSGSELQNPRLVDQIARQLEAYDIAPERLNIEVLETVIALETDEDIVANLAALADLGCGIDLDDFGAGYASIANIRRFSIGRIKIDRSFIRGIDTDGGQLKMVEAMINMAQRLGVSTLAEGVETAAERDRLQHLGCTAMQGFLIARPMPLGQTFDWAAAQFSERHNPQALTRRAS